MILDSDSIDTLPSDAATSPGEPADDDVIFDRRRSLEVRSEPPITLPGIIEEVEENEDASPLGDVNVCDVDTFTPRLVSHVSNSVNVDVQSVESPTGVATQDVVNSNIVGNQQEPEILNQDSELNVVEKHVNVVTVSSPMQLSTESLNAATEMTTIQGDDASVASSKSVDVVSEFTTEPVVVCEITDKPVDFVNVATHAFNGCQNVVTPNINSQSQNSPTGDVTTSSLQRSVYPASTEIALSNATFENNSSVDLADEAIDDEGVFAALTLGKNEGPVVTPVASQISARNEVIEPCIEAFESVPKEPNETAKAVEIAQVAREEANDCILAPEVEISVNASLETEVVEASQLPNLLPSDTPSAFAVYKPTKEQEYSQKTTAHPTELRRQTSANDEVKEKKGVITKILEFVGVKKREEEVPLASAVFYDEVEIESKIAVVDEEEKTVTSKGVEGIQEILAATDLSAVQLSLEEAAKRSPSPRINIPNVPHTHVIEATPPICPSQKPPRRDSESLTVDNFIPETPPIVEKKTPVVPEPQINRNEIMEEIDGIISKAKLIAADQLDDDPIYSNVIAATESPVALLPPIAICEDFEEIKVTPQDEKSRSRQPGSSKLAGQILKAIPPPRRRVISNSRGAAAAAAAAANPSIDVALEEKEVSSRSISITPSPSVSPVLVNAQAPPPVPPRRRSKHRQEPQPPPKRKPKQ